jgi:hypothetical protein
MISQLWVSPVWQLKLVPPQTRPTNPGTTCRARVLSLTSNQTPTRSKPRRSSSVACTTTREKPPLAPETESLFLLPPPSYPESNLHLWWLLLLLTILGTMRSRRVRQLRLFPCCLPSISWLQSGVAIRDKVWKRSKGWHQRKVVNLLILLSLNPITDTILIRHQQITQGSQDHSSSSWLTIHL